MANSIEQGLKDIFLAGVGALALTGEKATEIVDTLIEKGELTVEQGKDINSELKHKATTATSKIRNEALEQTINAMSEEEREEFAATVAKMVAEAKTSTEDAVEVEVEPEENEEA